MKNMILIFLFSSCLLLPGNNASGQYYYYNSRFYESDLLWEIGASAIGMNCLTDLGGRKAKGRSFLKDVDWMNTRPGVSFFGKLLYKQLMGLRAEVSFGKIAAFDSLSTNRFKAPGRYQRNLQVQSHILEVALLGECYPLTFLSANQQPLTAISPYLVAGIGFFHFNPMAKIENALVRLHPLRTEGQGFTEYPDRKPYALNQWNLPFGIGFKYEISALFICGVELLYRKLFTDYLDDVSTTYIDPMLFIKYLSPAEAARAAVMADPVRKDFPLHEPGARRGNPANNDAYLSINLKAALAIGRQRR
jgi:hypothetical protein